ncbi:MAG: hypothetical protein LBE36_02630 [Flavobacteriaceae bacterium]|jgi:hypothetical protein|nr:hypothetical protein [Flavobacteriaceae bacterium]
MERNRKREIQMKIFRFFVREKWRKPVKEYFYSKRADWRYRNFIKKNRNKIFEKIPNLVVTLTSYPKRISTISETLISLLDQSIKPEKVILWLANEEFPNKEKDLSPKILKLKNFGLEICWCRNLKSYKKLIPALEWDKNKIYVTADDDIFYPKNWLKNLYEDYQKDKHSIFCHRVHRLAFDENGNIKPYKDWEKCLKKGQEKESDVLFFTGSGGVLYPPNCFYKDILDENLFKKLCPIADDLWFWMMVILNKRKIKIVKNNVYRIRNNFGTQEEEPLWKTNREAGYNDDQLKNLLEYYSQKPNDLKMYFV